METFPANTDEPLLAGWGVPPERSHTKGTGDIRVETGREFVWRLAPPTPPTGQHRMFVTHVEHYDQERAGHPVGGDSVGAEKLPRTWHDVESQAGRRDTIGAGTARAWFQLDDLPSSGKNVFFDTGCTCPSSTGSSTNMELERLTVAWDGDRKEVAMRVRDETLDGQRAPNDLRPPFEVITSVKFPRAIELHGAPRSFRGKNWYHIAAAWKGSDRGDLALFVDGYAVGVEKQPGQTYLKAPLDRWSRRIFVEKDDELPDRGVIWIGGYRKDGAPSGAGEVLLYEKTGAGGLLTIDDWDRIRRLDADYPNAQYRITALMNGKPMRNLPQQFPADSERPERWRVPVRGSGWIHRVAGSWTDQQGNRWPINFDFPTGFSHEKGAPVRVWGYTSFVKERPDGDMPRGQIHKGGATLTKPLPENTPFTLVFMNKPPGFNVQTNPTPIVVQRNDAVVPVISTDGFPEEGVIRIGNERIHYRGRGPYAFQNCTRLFETNAADAFAPTEPQEHRLWEHVSLESIELDGVPDLPPRALARDAKVLVQLTPAAFAADPRAWRNEVLSLDRKPKVEWVSVQVSSQRKGFLLMPAHETVVPAGRTFYEPDPAAVPGAPARTWPLGVPYTRGDNRFISELQTLFRNRQGNLGNAPDLDTVTVQPQLAGGYLPRPGTTKTVREWLKGIEANVSRAQKSTIDEKLFDYNVVVADARRQGQPAPWPEQVGVTSAGGGRAHPAGEGLLPTFVLRREGAFDAWGGRGDVVTVADDTGATPEEHWTTYEADARVLIIVTVRSRDPQNPRNIITIRVPCREDVAEGTMVALDGPVARTLLVSDNARLAKWPTGLLPRPRPLAIGRPAIDDPNARPLKNAKIDELIVTQEMDTDGANGLVVEARDIRRVENAENGAASPFAFAAKDEKWGVDSGLPLGRKVWASGRLLRLSDDAQMPDGSRLPDEVLGCVNAFGDESSAKIARFVRGALTTTAVDHCGEAPLWLLPFPKSSALEGGFGEPREQTIQLRDGGPFSFAQHFKESDGYIALDRGEGKGFLEILPYRKRPFGRATLFRPRDVFDRGCFRGAFGTAPADPPLGADDLVVDLPFRAHDRFAPRVDSLEGVFFEASRDIPGGYLVDVHWESSGDSESPAGDRNPFASLAVAVRVDERPGWGAEWVPLARSGDGATLGITDKLYVFTDPKKKNQVLLRGDRFEVRVYPTFKKDAFKSDAWKSVTLLDGLKIGYRRPIRIRRREELPQ